VRGGEGEGQGAADGAACRPALGADWERDTVHQLSAATGGGVFFPEAGDSLKVEIQVVVLGVRGVEFALVLK
jgi:hypothetical protein